MARVEFSGLNVDSELDGLSLAGVEFSGLNIDSELDGLSVARFEFSGLNTKSSTHGTVVFWSTTDIMRLRSKDEPDKRIHQGII
jgi:hypothetical protein